jgi:hypothetical protein
MTTAAVMAFKSGADFVALSGLQVKRILSAELFWEQAGLSTHASQPRIPAACHDRWTDLAASLISLPEPVEALMVIAHPDERKPGGDRLVLCFLAIGRGKNKKEAEENCLRGFGGLRRLLATTLDYAELQPVCDQSQLEAVFSCLQGPNALEIKRRLIRIPVSHGCVNVPLGFELGTPFPGQQDQTEPLVSIAHLFPWVPSDDPWRRLTEVLSDEPGPVSFAVHVQGFGRVPASSQDEIRDAMAEAEKIACGDLQPDQSKVETVLTTATETLRRELLSRLIILQGGVLAARVFLSGAASPSPAAIATIIQSIDDASVRDDQAGAQTLFRGGADIRIANPKEILESFGQPGIDVLFGPREASAIWRTPMPIEVDLPGLPVNRSRTSALTGTSGDDCPLGLNIHRDLRIPIALDGPSRFRHAYVIGQTGTGKSTLLLHMILHDIHKGRGVAVLDPHGTLIDDILTRFPESRLNDLILMDVGDIEKPVGFNLLRIVEKDPLTYRMARDYIIDDIYSYLARTYDEKETMGPIFETHFRGMLSLLMGLKAQEAPFIPNLMIFRTLYTNRKFLEKLAGRLQGKDIMIEDFLKETLAAGGDATLTNIAPYITSKFNRFISDMALRNMTCQNEVLDLGRIIRESKVLLFHLRRGRIGDTVAGLLASQIVSRIRYEVLKAGAYREHTPFYLYADEFQTFADERFGELLAEARKFGLSLTLAHQFAKQLPEKILHAILGNVGTMVVFRTGADDAKLLEPLFAPTIRDRDISSLPNYRAYIRPSGLLGQTPFSVEMLPTPPEANQERGAKARELSRARYGRDRAVVEQEIMETYHAYKNVGTLDKIP